MLEVVCANLFLNTFSALMGLIVAWQIKKRSFVPVSDWILVAMQQTLSVSIGYSKLVFSVPFHHMLIL